MLKRMTVLMLSLGVVTVFLTAPASADVLQVQFQQNTGSADQAGWLQIAGPGPSLSHTVSGGDFNGVGIAATGSHVRSYGSVDHSDGDLDALLGGGVLTNTDNNPDVVTLTLTGLANGNYSITTYHHAAVLGAGAITFDVKLTDGVVTDSLVHDDVSISFGASVTTAGLSSLVTDFTVSNDSDTILVFDRTGGGGGRGDHLVLNGFELVPEPATMALLGLGFAGMAALRRRRRR